MEDTAKKCKYFFNHFAGAIYLSLVILIWVVSAMIIQMMYNSESNPATPLFLTYYSTSFFIIYLIPKALKLLKDKLFGEDLETSNTSSHNEINRMHKSKLRIH